MEEEKYVEMRVPSGETIAIRESEWQFYAKRPGHELLGDRKELETVIDEILVPPQEERTEEFMCNECSYRGPSKVALHAHKLGAHRNKEKREEKKVWSWGK